MKFLMFLIVLIPLTVFAQESKDPYDKNMIVKVDQDPFYPAGEMKMYENVFYNLNYSQEAIDAKATGEVTLSFSVYPDSTLSDFKIVKKVGFDIENQIIDLMKAMKFAPGKRNGEAVKKNLMMSFPIEVE